MKITKIYMLIFIITSLLSCSSNEVKKKSCSKIMSEYSYYWKDYKRVGGSNLHEMKLNKLSQQYDNNRCKGSAGYMQKQVMVFGK